MRQGDYVQNLANAIEAKLNMSDRDIKNLSQSEFKSLLKNVFFSGKKYTHQQTEPTDRQMDVLNLYYGKKVFITQQKTYNVRGQYFNKRRDTGKRYTPSYIRKNKAGRIIDAKTGRFVRIKK